MLHTIRPRLNHATVVAYLALFVALGGTSYSAVKISGKSIQSHSIAGTKLRDRTIAARNVRRNTLGGTEINESKLAIVPTARDASRLGGLAAGAFLRTGGKAADADTIDGIDSTGFLPNAPPEVYREVGQPGQPAFGTGWSNEDGLGTEATTAFFKDAFGVVHLKGLAARAGANATIFTLPEGYRPTKIVCLMTERANPTPVMPGYNCIFPDGRVQQSHPGVDGTYLLDGMTFRAGAG